MPEVTGPRVPRALRGPRGPGSASELGLNWKQVLGTSRRKGTGGEEGWGGAGGQRGLQAMVGGKQGAHLAAEGWREASRWLGPPCPVLGRLGVPGGCAAARCCAAVSSVSSPPPPRPVPHILREALPCASSAGRAGGRHPPPAPRSSGPGFLSRRVCLLQISALLPPVHSPHLLSHLSPASRSLFFLLPAASPSSQPWGFSPLCCLLILGRILLSSLLPWLQSSLRSLGQRGGQGGGSIGHHLLIFFPLVSKYFAFSRSAGAGLAGSCPAPNQPRHHGQGKAGRAAASVAVGCRGVWAAGAGGDVHCWRLTPTAGHR